jgi:hypothetical protein
MGRCTAHGMVTTRASKGCCRIIVQNQTYRRQTCAAVLVAWILEASAVDTTWPTRNSSRYHSTPKLPILTIKVLRLAGEGCYRRRPYCEYPAVAKQVCARFYLVELSCRAQQPL